jgi:hypothetical protein
MWRATPGGNAWETCRGNAFASGRKNAESGSSGEWGCGNAAKG